MNDVDTRVVTDTQTDRHTDTQDKYRNPPAHARRGLTIHSVCMLLTCTMYVYVAIQVKYMYCTYTCTRYMHVPYALNHCPCFSQQGPN